MSSSNDLTIIPGKAYVTRAGKCVVPLNRDIDTETGREYKDRGEITNWPYFAGKESYNVEGRTAAMSETSEDIVAEMPQLPEQSPILARVAEIEALGMRVSLLARVREAHIYAGHDIDVAKYVPADKFSIEQALIGLIAEYDRKYPNGYKPC